MDHYLDSVIISAILNFVEIHKKLVHKRWEPSLAFDVRTCLHNAKEEDKIRSGNHGILVYIISSLLHLANGLQCGMSIPGGSTHRSGLQVKVDCCVYWREINAKSCEIIEIVVIWRRRRRRRRRRMRGWGCWGREWWGERSGERNHCFRLHWDEYNGTWPLSVILPFSFGRFAHYKVLHIHTLPHQSCIKSLLEFE